MCLVHSKAELYVNLRNVLMCGSLGKVSACRHVYKELLIGIFTVSITYHKDFVHLKLIRVFVGSSPCRLTQGHGCARVSHWDWNLREDRFQLLNAIGKGGFSEIYKAFDLEQMCSGAAKMKFDI